MVLRYPNILIVTFENNNVNYQTNDSRIFNEKDVIECFCKIGSVTYSEDRMNINYGSNNYNVAILKRL